MTIAVDFGRKATKQTSFALSLTLVLTSFSNLVRSKTLMLILYLKTHVVGFSDRGGGGVEKGGGVSPPCCSADL